VFKMKFYGLATLVCALLYVLFAGTGCERAKKLLPQTKPILLENVKPDDFQGEWVNKKYITILRETRSPFKAQIATSGVSQVSVTRKFQSNGITIIRNMHSGGVMQADFDPYTSVISLNSNTAQNIKSGATLTLLKIGSDTLLSVKEIGGGKDKEAASIHQLKKISTHLETFENFLNRELFSGSYSVSGAAAKSLKGSIFAMLSNGKVMGHRQFKNYRVWFDFNDDVPQMDVIIFKTFSGKQIWCTWKLANRKLTFYRLLKQGKQMTSEAKIGNPEISLIALDR